jgi:hypothetical protein
MTDVNSTYTSLKDAINIGLSCLGETPVSAPDNTSTNVVLAKQIIEEVSRDIQSKGWWFNTSGSDISLYANSGSGASEDFNSSIPEEARRYIAIRAARVLQSRFVGSEELLKFSFQEEQVSLAILTQAHVRNGGGSTSFNSFPADLKGMGVEEVLFLQQSAEEKLLSLRLVTELKSGDKLAAETALIADQEDLVEQQVLTEVQETAKRGSEKDLVDAQKSSVQTDTVLKSQQALTELENTAKVTAETSLIGEQEDLIEAQALDVEADTALKTSQKTQLDAQTAIEATAEKAFFDGVVAGTQNTYRDFAAEMRIMGVQEAQFQQTPAYKKIELLSDATKLRTATATETGSDATELSEVNKVMRFIGEAPVTALNSNSLASECIRLLRDTDKELQGRGWWFNTERDVELTANVSGQITVPTDALSVELNAYATRIKTVGGVRYLYDLKDKSYTSWSGTVKAKVIYERTLSDTPQKYLEYLSVRVAILLTELYPQSGIDIQRLPKMEEELRAYFKDREADEANYSVFDNYDTASRIGINRNYDLS